MAKKKAAPVKKTAAKTPTKSVKETKKTATKTAKVQTKRTLAPVKTATKKASVAKKAAPAKKKAAPKKTVAAKKQVAKSTKTVGKITPKVIKDETQILADAIVEGILEVKGRNISVLDLKGIHNRVCDYFIICQADSNTQVNAIAGSVEEMVKKRTGERPYRKEGFENSEWILVDYVTVVVHIFQTQIRNFYNLESLWADAEVTEIAFD
jgi:ribosome-associated protein